MARCIAPSMLSADFGRVNEVCAMLDSSRADRIHLDILDGVFAPNISFGFPVCEAIAAALHKPLDIHLMIVHPENYIDRFAALKGAEYISVHIEACGKNLRNVLRQIRSLGLKAGVAINPGTPVESLIEYFGQFDFAMVMGVNPGYSGQKYIPQTEERVTIISEMASAAEAQFFIEVDGGVGKANIGALQAAGATVFVAGSATFSAPDPVLAIAELAGDQNNVVPFVG